MGAAGRVIAEVAEEIGANLSLSWVIDPPVRWRDGLSNFGTPDRNDAARPHQIKIERDAARNKPGRAHAPCPTLEIYNPRFVHLF